MAVTPSDVLFAWSADHGIEPTVGGDPTFTRGGEKYVRTRQRGGSPLYAPVQGDQVGYSWVEKDGVLLPRRALVAEYAVLSEIADTVRFDSGSTWNRNNIRSEEEKASAFVSLPTNGEARSFRGDGANQLLLWQSVGTFDGGPEAFSIVYEEHSGTERFSSIGLRDTTAGGWVLLASIDWDNENFVQSSAGLGSQTYVTGEILAREGPNGGRVVRIKAAGIPDNSGNNARIFVYPGGTGTTPSTDGAIAHHVQHTRSGRAIGSPSPMVHVGSPTTRPTDDVRFDVGFKPQDMLFLVSLYGLGSVQANLTGSPRGIWRWGVNGSSTGESQLQIRGGADAVDSGGAWFQHNDDNGSYNSRRTSGLGVTVGRRVDLVCKADGTNDVLRGIIDVDRGNLFDTGPGSLGPFGATFGGDEAQTFVFDGPLGAYLRVLAVKLGAVDAPHDGSDDRALVNELVDVPIGPNLAGHPQP